MNDVVDLLSVTTHDTYFLNFGGFLLFSVFELDTATSLTKIVDDTMSSQISCLQENVKQYFSFCTTNNY